MSKHITLLIAALVLFMQGQAQTLRLRSNTLENLHIVCIGSDNSGHTVSHTIYDVSYDFWKTISIFDIKYGHDKYNNEETQHSQYDSTLKWKMLVIYNNSTSRYDTLNITERAKDVHLGYANVRAKVTLSYERKYVITEVVLNDED